MSTQHKYPYANIVQSRRFFAGGVVSLLVGAFIITPPGAELYAPVGGYLGLLMESMEHPLVAGIILVIFGAIFAVIGGVSYFPRLRAYETDDIGIRRQGSEKTRLKWSEIERISLLEVRLTTSKYEWNRRNKLITPDVEHRYYAQGYPFFFTGYVYLLRLKIKGKGAAFTLDSPLSGFKDILARTAGLIAEGRIEADDDTRKNFETLGYPLK